MTASVSEACDVALVTAGVIAGVVLFAVMEAGGAEEVSVDTGTTETPVFDVAGLEVEVGVTDGTVELTMGVADGLDVVLDVADGVKDVIVPVTEVP